MVYGMDTGQLESPADRYGQGSRFYKNTKRVLKVLAYFFYFLLVLTSAIASKGSFLLMTQSLGNPKQERQYASRWSMLITAAMCIPYIFTFMESIAHSLFRNRKGPSIFDVMMVITQLNCKMGDINKDKYSVVDNKLNVHGIKKLKIIDGSIMPDITNANTNAPIVMIAEKGVDLIIKQYQK